MNNLIKKVRWIQFPEQNWNGAKGDCKVQWLLPQAWSCRETLSPEHAENMRQNFLVFKYIMISGGNNGF